MSFPAPLACVFLAGLLASLPLSASAQMLKDLVAAAPKEDPAPMPHVNPDDPTQMNIRQDKSTNIWRELRDPARNPQGAGPVDIQRYQLQMEPVGIQTFFKLPVALTPEDLVAGEIDVAIFGAPTGALPHSAGNMWAPAEVRTTRDYGGYGDPKFPLSWVEYETLIAPFTLINAVDYGDAGMNAYNQAQTLEEIRRLTREVASVGAIPFIVGGDHSVPNGTFRGIVDVYGRKNVAFLHFDVHLDRGQGKFGAFYHSGSFMTLAVEEGLVEGSKVIQYGMATPVFGESDWDQVLAEGGKVYHIHEIRRDGVEETFDKIYEDLKDIDLVYVSFDIDTFDMSYAPGTGSSSPIGSHPEDLFPMLREFAARKTIVGVDFVEFNPFYDNKGQQTARLVRRTMFQFLTGIAMKKAGIAPDYIHPRVAGKP
ncbi:arginase family protein [Rhodovibrionaceae bacterium A322]